MITLTPIGVARTPYTETSQIPKGPGARHLADGQLQIRPEFAPGLLDIEGFSHLFVLWIFDRADGFDLEARPPTDDRPHGVFATRPTDDRPHGVFATRSPRRPNAIGLTVVELLGRDGGTLRVRGVDMLDGTPIVDLKPYLSSIPQDQLRRGWLGEAERRERNK